MVSYRVLLCILFTFLSSCSFAQLAEEYVSAIEATRQARGEFNGDEINRIQDFLTTGKFGCCFDASIPKERIVKSIAPIEGKFPPLTIECWVRCNNENNYNVFISYYPKDSRYHWELYSYAGSGKLSFFIPGYTPANVTTDFVVTDDRWHYIAAILKKDSITLGMDGNVHKEIPIVAHDNLRESEGPLVIGAAYTTASFVGCNGSIDEVRLSTCVRNIESIPMAPFSCDDKTIRLVHFNDLEKEQTFKDACKYNIHYYPSNSPVTQKEGFVAGVGSSSESDLKCAISDAATQALSGIGSSKVKAVLVFDRLNPSDDQRTAMLEQLAWFFPKETIFGCNGFGPIATTTNETGITILVLAGDIKVQASLFDLGNDGEAYSQAGQKLAGTVTDEIAKNPAESHNLVILLGDMHVPEHDKVTAPFDNLVRQGVTVTGAAHPLNGYLFYQGQIKYRHCMSLLVSGDFNCKTSMEKGEGLEGTVASAILASQKAYDSSRNPKLVLVFNCASRLRAMGDDIMRELYGIKSVYGDVPIAGFYSSGEIGPVDNQNSIGGRGQMISICSIYSD